MEKKKAPVLASLALLLASNFPSSRLLQLVNFNPGQYTIPVRQDPLESLNQRKLESSPEIIEQIALYRMRQDRGYRQGSELPEQLVTATWDIRF